MDHTYTIKSFRAITKMDEINLVLSKAPLHYGYLLILIYQDNDLLFASSRHPSTYMNTFMARERQHGVDNPVLLLASPIVSRCEAIKTALQKRFATYRKSNAGLRFAIPDDILRKELDDVFSTASFLNASDQNSGG